RGTAGPVAARSRLSTPELKGLSGWLAGEPLPFSERILLKVLTDLLGFRQYGDISQTATPARRTQCPLSSKVGSALSTGSAARSTPSRRRRPFSVAVWPTG